MQHLGPEIFGRIVPARMAGIIDRRLGAKCLDLSTFLRARMVFPEDEHRVRILLVTRFQAERDHLVIGQTGGTGRGVHGNGGYRPRIGTGGDHLAEHLGHGLYIIPGMLAVAILRGIAVQPLHPAGIIADGVDVFVTVFRIHQDRTDRIGPEVHSYDKFLIHR